MGGVSNIVSSTIFGIFIGKVFGVGEFNMLSEIIKEPRELPWQPNLGKNKQKKERTNFSSAQKNPVTKFRQK